MPRAFPSALRGITLDFTLVWIGIALALIAAIFLGFVPRLPAADPSRGISLTSGGARVTGSSTRRLRLFAITQITASFLLLAGAAALMKTLMVLEQTRPQFDTSHVLAINLPVMNYGRTDAQVQDFYRDVKQRVARYPRRRARLYWIRCALARCSGARHQIYLRHAGRDPARTAKTICAPNSRAVSPGFFETLGLPLIAGRDFRGHR